MNIRRRLRPRTKGWKAGVRAGIALALLGLLLVGSSALAHAAPGDEPCVECHSLEARTWEQSAHAATLTGTALPAAQCTACHGAYSEAHPEDDLMALDVSSATCATCHTETYAQWETTIHAGNDVQCIGCHQAHSQDLRLGGQTLCASCHTAPNDDPFHKAHWLAETACIDCHMTGVAAGDELAAPAELLATTAGAQLAIAQQTGFAPLGPDHDFVTVSPRRCLDCHREDVQSTVAGHTAVETRLLQSEQSNSRLSNELDATLRNLRTAQGLTPVALGMGLGLGGMLGILVMLAFARADRGRPEETPSRDWGDES